MLKHSSSGMATGSENISAQHCPRLGRRVEKDHFAHPEQSMHRAPSLEVFKARSDGDLSDLV